MSRPAPNKPPTGTSDELAILARLGFGMAVDAVVVGLMVAAVLVWAAAAS